jgi:hypothetical protein
MSLPPAYPLSNMLAAVVLGCGTLRLCATLLRMEVSAEEEHQPSGFEFPHPQTIRDGHVAVSLTFPRRLVGCPTFHHPGPSVSNYFGLELDSAPFWFHLPLSPPPTPRPRLCRSPPLPLPGAHIHFGVLLLMTRPYGGCNSQKYSEHQITFQMSIRRNVTMPARRVPPKAEHGAGIAMFSMF